MVSVAERKRSFGIADRREKIIVLASAVRTFGRADVKRRHPVGFEPDAHGESAPAENIRPLHAADRGKAGLHDPDEIIGHFVRLENVGGKAEIGRGELRVRRLDA